MPIELAAAIFYTVAEAAGITRRSKRLIQRHIKADKLNATKQSGATGGYLIAADDLAAWQKRFDAGELPKAGRPAKEKSND